MRKTSGGFDEYVQMEIAWLWVDEPEMGGGRRVGMYFKEYTRKIVGIDPLLNKEVLHQLTK